MTETILAGVLLLAAAATSYAAFALLALAMPRHWADIRGQRLARVPRGRAMRAAAAGLLAVGYALCAWRDGPSFGTVLWVILLGAAAFGVALTLALKPRARRSR